MRVTRTATGTLATVIALLVLPSAATAEYLVPPSNSAATQYTETVPTSGGGRDSERGGKDRSPAAVVGERNARRLREHGAEGERVAELVATTAPAPAKDAEATRSPDRDDEDEAPREKRGEGVGIGGGAGGAGPMAPGVSGSAGLGEVLAQATGVAPTGELGPLLPLAIVLTAAWALAFLLRRRQRPTPEPSARDPLF